MKTDNLDSGRVDNISDIPRLSANEKVRAGDVAAESGRIASTRVKRTGVLAIDLGLSLVVGILTFII